jgi:shikimate kinase/3-dehydroquinate synthase
MSAMLDESAAPLLPLPVVLIGPPAAGKSTVGRALASALGARFIDVDDEIVCAAGASIENIFEREGEGGFRVWEHRVLSRALDEEGPLIIALGAGGHVSHASARMLRHRALPVLLDVDRASVLARIDDARSRPLLVGDLQARLATLELGRAEARRTVARIVVDGNAPVADVVRAIRVELAAPLARAFSLPTPADTLPDDVVFADVMPGIEQVRAESRARSLVAIVDDRVRHRLDERVFARVISLRASEVKTGAKALALAEELVALPRDALLVGIGGGSVLDATGFVAHIVRRGIPHMLVPTTLLAMVDAAHGGKTALDAGGARNAIGAYHPPRSVVIDPGFIDDESIAGRRSGAVEILKKEFIRTDAPVDGRGVDDDRALRALVEGRASRDGMQRTISRAIAMKRAIVDVDPHDRGPRMALNLGHTIGHGIEAASGFTVAHGEGVRRGMRAAIALSVRRVALAPDRAERLMSRLRMLAPPSVDENVRGLDPSVVRNALANDKKRSARGVRFVLLSALGCVVIDEPTEADIAFAIACALDDEA